MKRKICSRCGEEKDPSKREFSPDSRNADGLAARCKVCQASVARERRLSDPEKARAIRKRYNKNHPDRVREYRTKYMARPGVRELQAARNKSWLQRNAAKNRAKVRAHEARKRGATPPWADLRAIERVYEEAVRLTRETGTPHHVDHIVPLNHPLVCGLHVPANLRVIPARENIAKRNRHWPGMLDCQRVVR